MAHLAGPEFSEHNHSEYYAIQAEGPVTYTPFITFTRLAGELSGRMPTSLLLPAEADRSPSELEQILRMNWFRLKHFRKFRQLTEREVDVLRLLANGRNNPRIAEELFLSRQTVETHRKNLKRKLGLRSFLDLMRYAFAFNLIEC